MPHFTVHAVEDDLAGRESELFSHLTEAVVAVYGERARPLVAVQLIGLPRNRFGVAGRPAERVVPTVTLGMREPALTPTSDDPVARLIGSITDAMVTVYGEPVRPDLVVEIVGVPTGRSGVAGVPV